MRDASRAAGFRSSALGLENSLSQIKVNLLLRHESGLKWR